MIDDVTFVGLAPDGVSDDPPGFVPGVVPLGRPLKLISSRARGALIIEYTPSNRLIGVRLSVPRWLSRTRLANFPLVPIEGSDDLRIEAIQREVRLAFGLRATPTNPGDDRAFDLRTWIVTRVSYALDLPVSDAQGVIVGCEGLPRRHAGLTQTFGHPTETLQWGRTSYTVKLYAKGIELSNAARWVRDPAERAQLGRLADQARNVVRFEITFRQVKAIRTFFRLGRRRQLPTLALMCNPLTATWALTREARRLRLDKPFVRSDPEPMGAHMRHVVAHLRQTQEQLRGGGGKLGRRATLTNNRMKQLIFAYALLSGHVLKEAATILGCSESTIRDLQRDLIELGLTPDGSAAAALGSSAQEVHEALLPSLLAWISLDLPEWDDEMSWGPPPWFVGGLVGGVNAADEYGEGDDDAEGEGEEPSLVVFPAEELEGESWG